MPGTSLSPAREAPFPARALTFALGVSGPDPLLVLLLEILEAIELVRDVKVALEVRDDLGRRATPETARRREGGENNARGLGVDGGRANQ